MAAPRPAPTVLSTAVVAAAEAGDAEATLSLFDAEGYASIDTRSLYQSTLLHVAAKHGHVELARRLLERGADVNVLDYGGMRRSPLHWACKGARASGGGNVAMVELLVDAGADTKADGRSWSKLVQGQRCGNLIPRDEPTESVESLCRTNAVRLALTRPQWQPSIHYMWPERFKQAARLLLLASSCSPSLSQANPSSSYNSNAGSSGVAGALGASSSGSSSGQEEHGRLQLTRDTLLLVLQRAAYPISAWEAAP